MTDSSSQPTDTSQIKHALFSKDPSGVLACGSFIQCGDLCIRQAVG